MLYMFRKLRHQLLNQTSYPSERTYDEHSPKGNNQSSMAKKKTRQYILYALGEVFLVMIGILLALQVNNWNEWRKDRKTEKEYFRFLIDEINMNNEMALNNIEYHDFLLANAQLILDVISGEEPSPDEEYLAIALEQIGWTYYYNSVSDVWTDLNTTGNNKIVTNRKISALLKDYYRSLERYHKEEQETVSFHLGIRRTLGDFLPPVLRLNISQNLHPENYHGEIDLALIEDVDFAALSDMAELRGFLSDIIMGRKVTRYLLKSIIEKGSEITSILEKELNN